MSDNLAEKDPAWMEACRREAAIRDLLRRYPDRLTKRAVEDAASELGLSRSTLYRLIGRYRAARTVDLLLDHPLGRPRGSLHEEPVRDALIKEFLEREYLKPTRPPLRRVVGHIAAAWRQQGLPVPTRRTVKARLLLIDERIRASRIGEEGLLGARIATPGQYQVTRPLEVVQVDHMQVYVMVLDEASLGQSTKAGPPPSSVMTVTVFLL
ncbi:MAG: helix-turn-helix domain-containing protein [Acetobacteraceae bacterium]|nr:helix-turn-helix domain-containing protein [Acetobacteraceae bacterium]